MRHHFGITSFGVNAWTAAAGERMLNEHDEAGDSEELYLVHRGRATFELDGERVDAPAGTFIFAPPGVLRTAFAEEPGTTILAIGGTPGEAYEPDRLGGVDACRPSLQRREVRPGRRAHPRARGRPPAAADARLHARLLREQAGHTEAALEALRAAAASRRMRRIAAKDPELDAIRGEPAFAEIIGS